MQLNIAVRHLLGDTFMTQRLQLVKSFQVIEANIFVAEKAGMTHELMRTGLQLS